MKKIKKTYFSIINKIIAIIAAFTGLQACGTPYAHSIGGHPYSQDENIVIPNSESINPMQ